MRSLKQWLRWDNLSAVKNENLFVVDASLVTRPGMRMLQGAEQICAHLERAARIDSTRAGRITQSNRVNRWEYLNAT